MPSSFWSFFFTIVGTIFLVGILIMPFTLFVAATIVRQRRSPASSVTWLLTILFMPLVGIPLFWLFSSRKINQIARTKPRVELTIRDAVGTEAAHSAMSQAAADLGSQGITRGNTMKFHANGEEAFADLTALIDGAQKSISIETYELKGDETGKAIVDRLIARAGAGVEV
jgi:cardiolipin synthase A/B